MPTVYLSLSFSLSLTVSILPENPRNFNVDNVRVTKILVSFVILGL